MLTTFCNAGTVSIVKPRQEAVIVAVVVPSFLPNTSAPVNSAIVASADTKVTSASVNVLPLNLIIGLNV